MTRWRVTVSQVGTGVPVHETVVETHTAMRACYLATEEARELGATGQLDADAEEEGLEPWR